jgi:hypothetical protein
LTLNNGVASGSFSAPDHEYPAWIELRLTATDSVRLDPQTVGLSFQSNPTGLQLTVGSGTLCVRLLVQRPAPPNTTSPPPPQRREAAVDDDWGPGGPNGVGVGTDNFSVRWVKTQNLGDPVAKVSIAP